MYHFSCANLVYTSQDFIYLYDKMLICIVKLTDNSSEERRKQKYKLALKKRVKWSTMCI